MSDSTTWPAFNVERRSIAELKPYLNNARTHSKEQVAQIAASMTEWGFTNPILIDEAGMIIAGHGRVQAAKVLGVSEIPTIVARGWSEAQKRAYVLADNQLAINAGWDENLLRLEIGAIKGLDFDIGTIGFGNEFLSDLFATKEGKTDPDDVPEPPVVPVTALGDVWLLGDHRIICGDSTDKATVEALLGHDRPHLMVTDPPYGMEYDPNWRNEAARSSEGMGNRALGTDAIGKVLNDDRADWREAWALFPGDVAYVWHAGLFSREVQDSLEACSFKMRAQIIWAKDRFALSRGDYHWQHEPYWYAVKKGGPTHKIPDTPQTAFRQRQDRLGPVKRLDLALLVNRQHDGVGWRIDIKSDHIAQLVDELWIAGQLELPVTMRLEPMGLLNAPDGAGADAAGLRHHIRRPVGRLARRIDERQRHHALGHYSAKRGNA